MKFQSIHNVRLVDIRSFTSKNGKPLVFLKIADPVTYENVDMLPVRGLDINSLEIGADYQAVLNSDGRYNNIMLYGLDEVID